MPLPSLARGRWHALAFGPAGAGCAAQRHEGGGPGEARSGGQPRSSAPSARGLREVSSLAAEPGGRVLLDHAPEAGGPEEAQALADRLGGLPLALLLAGRYLAEGHGRHTSFGSRCRAW